jgi:hypothetical protein
VASLLLPARTRRRLLAALRTAIEQACDAEAARTTSPEAVASALVKFARAAGARPASVPAALQSYGDGDVAARVTCLLDVMPTGRPPCGTVRTLLLIVLVPACWVLHEAGEFLLKPLVH